MIYQKNSRQDILIRKKGKFLDESTQNVIGSVHMYNAHIEHSARDNCRPYLMMYGNVEMLAFPGGTYQRCNPSVPVHIRYEFSDAEIASLSEKGLFYDGFVCPDIISMNESIEIPFEVHASRYTCLDNMYVTVDLDTSGTYKTDTEKCGYTFADYFEMQVPVSNEKTEDAIPDFGAEKEGEPSFAPDQFEGQMLPEDMENGDFDDAAMRFAQDNYRQHMITLEAQKLLEKSPSVMRERQKAAKFLKVPESDKTDEDLKVTEPEETKEDKPAFSFDMEETEMLKDNKSITAEAQKQEELAEQEQEEQTGYGELDDDFAAFQRAQAAMNRTDTAEKSQKELAAEQFFGFGDNDDESGETMDEYMKKFMKGEEEREEEKKSRATTSGAVNVSVKTDGVDNTGNAGKEAGKETGKGEKNMDAEDKFLDEVLNEKEPELNEDLIGTTAERMTKVDQMRTVKPTVTDPMLDEVEGYRPLVDLAVEDPNEFGYL